MEGTPTVARTRTIDTGAKLSIPGRTASRGRPDRFLVGKWPQKPPNETRCYSRQFSSKILDRRRVFRFSWRENRTAIDVDTGRPIGVGENR